MLPISLTLKGPSTSPPGATMYQLNYIINKINLTDSSSPWDIAVKGFFKWEKVEFESSGSPDGLFYWESDDIYVFN